MFNLSLTACSFHVKKAYSRQGSGILPINHYFSVQNNDEKEVNFNSVLDLFKDFFIEHKIRYIDQEKQQSFSCDEKSLLCSENELFKMVTIKINSGTFGSASEIVDQKKNIVAYKKSASDLDIKPFYLMIVFPKDDGKVKVNKGMFIFQNCGQYGIKTITTQLMNKYFSEKYSLTLVCRTISSELFIKKVINKDSIKRIKVIRNVMSNDSSDKLYLSCGEESREFVGLNITESLWTKLSKKLQHYSGSKSNMFELDDGELFRTVKLTVEIGGKNRIIDLHNLENLSIIEAIPDEIQQQNGHPNLNKLLVHFEKVATEYLGEMVLYIK